MTLNPLGRVLLGAAVLMAGAMAVFVTLRVTGIGTSALPRAAVTLTTTVLAIWLAGRYWGRLDEVARAGQKDAYFWGGSMGAVVGFVALTVAVQSGWRPPVSGAGNQIMSGAIVVILAQTVGSVLAWAIWWSRRR